jgi:hypothetical protein
MASKFLKSDKHFIGFSISEMSYLCGSEDLKKEFADEVIEPEEKHSVGYLSELEVEAMALATGVVVLHGSTLAEKYNCKGWYRDASSWLGKYSLTAKSTQGKARPTHVTKASTDFKFRSKLCSHWELTGGTNCPMKKKVTVSLLHLLFFLQKKY